MPRITYIEHNGTEHVVDASVGSTVMNTAVDNLVPGIDADCGGECSCATCHVMVDPAWMEKVGSPNERENQMLDQNPDRQESSRLSCQIPVTKELDGLVVTVPEFQL